MGYNGMQYLGANYGAFLLGVNRRQTSFDKLASKHNAVLLMIVPYDCHSQVMENRAQNHNNFSILVLHSIILHDTRLNLLIHQDAEQLERQISHDLNVRWTV